MSTSLGRVLALCLVLVCVAPTSAPQAAFRECVLSEIDRTPTIEDHRYRIEAELGSGSYGVVYLAYRFGPDGKLDRSRGYAIKIEKSLAGIPSKPHVTAAEVRAIEAIGLREPAVGLLRYRGKGTTRLGHAIVFDAVPHSVTLGEMMDTLTAQGRVAADDHWTARLFSIVGRALSHIHKKGLIHQDVKPDNILINAEGEVVLADYGLSKTPEEASHRAETEGVVEGTSEYMSAEAHVGQASWRGDLYSLGVTLYELLEGRHPYRGSTRKVTVQNALDIRKGLKPFPSVVHASPAMRKVLARIFGQWLHADDASWRLPKPYPSMDALVHDLEVIAGPQPSR